MTSTEKADTIRNNMAPDGWIQDRWGHMKKIINNKQYRYKFQKNTIRYEVQTELTDWVRLKTYNINKVVKWLTQDPTRSFIRGC
jgi:hypothetical protein